MLRVAGLHIPRASMSFLIADSVIVLVALTSATLLGMLLMGVVPHYGADMFARFLVVVLVWVIALYYNELYDTRKARRRSETFVRVLQACGLSYLVLAVIYFVAPNSGISRPIAILAAPAIPALLLSCRFLAEPTNLLGQVERVLVVGTAEEGIVLVREILGRPQLNLKVVGFLDEKGEDLGKSLVNPAIIGAVGDLESIAVSQRIDRVVLAVQERRGGTPVHQLLRLKLAGVSVEEAHSMYEKLTGRVLLQRLTLSSLILSDGFHRSNFAKLAKRVVEIFASLVGLLVAGPIMALTAAAIWIETGRPILFRQQRVGMWGREFEILKFRSMYQNAEAHGPVWAANNDSRVTRVGRFIRRSRLDELPQLWNVLRGEMSLVGPRPERPPFVARLQASLPLYSMRHSVRPGITGWAQIKYQYGSSVEDAGQKLQLDLFYIKNYSLILDLAILLETVKVMVMARGAR